VKPAYRTLARYGEQDRDPERLNPRPEREAGLWGAASPGGLALATTLPILTLNALREIALLAAGPRSAPAPGTPPVTYQEWAFWGQVAWRSVTRQKPADQDVVALTELNAPPARCSIADLI
jgi:hypothetical protein